MVRNVIALAAIAYLCFAVGSWIAEFPVPLLHKLALALFAAILIATGVISVLDTE
jgi:hypothetical protein